jgi:hypothetical protein
MWWRYTSFVFIEEYAVRLDVRAGVGAQGLFGDEFDWAVQRLR